MGLINLQTAPVCLLSDKEGHVYQGFVFNFLVQCLHFSHPVPWHNIQETSSSPPGEVFAKEFLHPSSQPDRFVFGGVPTCI